MHEPREPSGRMFVRMRGETPLYDKFGPNECTFVRVPANLTQNGAVFAFVSALKKHAPNTVGEFLAQSPQARETFQIWPKLKRELGLPKSNREAYGQLRKRLELDALPGYSDTLAFQPNLVRSLQLRLKDGVRLIEVHHDAKSDVPYAITRDASFAEKHPGVKHRDLDRDAGYLTVLELPVGPKANQHWQDQSERPDQRYEEKARLVERVFVEAGKLFVPQKVRGPEAYSERMPSSLHTRRRENLEFLEQFLQRELAHARKT